MEAQRNIDGLLVELVEFVKDIVRLGHEQRNLSQDDVSFREISCGKGAPAGHAGLAHSDVVVVIIWAGRHFARGRRNQLYFCEVEHLQVANKMAICILFLLGGRFGRRCRAGIARAFTMRLV